MSDQKNTRDILNSRKPDFETIEQALAQLSCLDLDLAEKKLLEFKPEDKIVKVQTSSSYVKKICLKGKSQKVTVAGKHVGGGNSRAFYAVPGYFAYSSGKKVDGKFGFKRASFSGDLLISFNSNDKFDTLLVFLDTVDLEEPLSSVSSHVYAGGALIPTKVLIYKYPIGKVEVSLNE